MSGELPLDASGFPAGIVTEFETGSRIAGYRLAEQLGAGGMAVVFRAHDERLDRLVALKILAPALAADEAFRQRFIRESRAAAAVDDPHIVPVFEAGEAAGVLFIAMRYVPGGDILTLVKREGPLSAARAMAITSPVASALDAAHGAGLVHRDVKPANMLLDVRPGRPDHVYLADFGLSKGAVSSTGLTGIGKFLGTPDYTSPEQIGGKPVDGRTDQYALACAAFELLTGAPPFRRDEINALVYAQLSEPPPALTSRRPDLAPAADQVFARALAKTPGDRYPSCREFADALRAAFGLGPYDSGSWRTPPADHPPTQIARGVAPEDVAPTSAGAGGRAGGGAAAGAGMSGPAADQADWLTRDSDIPAGPARASGPGRPGGGDASGGDASGGDASGMRPAQRGRRRTLTVLIGVGILAAAGIVAGVLAFPGHPPMRSLSVPAVTSGNQPLNGYNFVTYQGGKYASAQVHGQIRGAASGEVARLYAQPFPYRRAPAQVSAVILHTAGGTAVYGFRVAPVVATRYLVKLYPSSTATAPLAGSAPTTIYVAASYSSNDDQKCSRPVCRQVFHIQYFVPPSALVTEMTKRFFAYFGLALAPVSEPAGPKLLQLGAGAANVADVRRISASEFDMTLTFSFSIGNDAYSFNWAPCLQDTEAADGIGLPGRHGCGSTQVPSSSSYLG